MFIKIAIIIGTTGSVTIMIQNILILLEKKIIAMEIIINIKIGVDQEVKKRVIDINIILNIENIIIKKMEEILIINQIVEHIKYIVVIQQKKKNIVIQILIRNHINQNLIQVHLVLLIRIYLTCCTPIK